MAAVSRLTDAPLPTTAIDLDRPAIDAAIRAARVGGSFWATVPAGAADVAVVLRPRSVAETWPMAACARDVASSASILAILPAAHWSRGAVRALRRDGVRAIVGEVDPWSLLGQGRTIIAAADDEFALLARLTETCFVPAAAVADQPRPAVGPGAERDGQPRDDELYRRLVLDICYRDPFADAPCSIGAAVAVLAEWRRVIEANRGIAVATGISRWKRRAVTAFLWNGSSIRFARSTGGALARARRSGAIAVWPSRAPPGLVTRAAAAEVPLILVEDGFVRSVGLGSNLVPPCSIVIDRQGIYYDPTRASALEAILAETRFDDQMRARAATLAATIVAAGISKYAIAQPGVGAVGVHPRARSAQGAALRPILVVGQVEDDLSVRLAGCGLGNLDLLTRARAAAPGAEIWFRPHPDVDAGHRVGAVPDRAALRLADRIVRDVPMAALLDQVEGVHVLSSLTGFEALLRGCDVTTHGQPFYAGWGLTRDLAPRLPRRTRRLSLDELVAGTLILYPRYLDPVTSLPCSPEILMQRLAAGVRPRVGWSSRLRALQGQLTLAVRKISIAATATRPSDLRQDGGAAA